MVDEMVPSTEPSGTPISNLSKCIDRLSNKNLLSAVGKIEIQINLEVALWCQSQCSVEILGCGSRQYRRWRSSQVGVEY